MPHPATHFHHGDPPVRLADADRKLLRLLHQLSFDERTHATNADLGILIGATDRTAQKGLGQLDAAGQIQVVRVAPHPVHHRTGRFIYLPEEDPR